MFICCTPSITATQTVAHYACFWGKLEVLKMLLDQETANLEEVDNDGNTPLMLAILEGYE